MQEKHVVNTYMEKVNSNNKSIPLHKKLTLSLWACHVYTFTHMWWLICGWLYYMLPPRSGPVRSGELASREPVEAVQNNTILLLLPKHFFGTIQLMKPHCLYNIHANGLRYTLHSMSKQCNIIYTVSMYIISVCPHDLNNYWSHALPNVIAIPSSACMYEQGS